MLARAGLLAAAAVPAGWLAAARVRAEAASAPPATTIAVVGAAGIAFAWVAVHGPLSWPLLLASLALAWTLVCLAAIDLAVYRLPDTLTLPLLAAGLAVALLLPGRPVGDHLVGAVSGWGVLAALAGLFRRWRGVEGIGLGDAKLFGAAGAWLGWAALPSVMLIACAAAFLWVAVRVVREGRGAVRARIAFGVPLALAILAVWLEGPLVV